MEECGFAHGYMVLPFLRRNTIALLALFVALSGTTYAAANIVLPKNSVGTKQLKKNAVTSPKIKNNTVTGADVKESSLGKVPSARNADHATSADSATNATNATNAANAAHATTATSATSATSAGNANTLGGLGPSAFVQKSEGFTRHFSCAGTAWENAFASNTYSVNNSEKYATGGSALFRCSLAIPDGAVITAANFGVVDTNATGSLSCSVWRTNMATSVGGETQLASVATTAAGTPGATRISDTTINQPTIDNDIYAYFAQCFVSGSDATVGVYGANVTYTVTGGQGAGNAVHAPAGPSTQGSSTSH
jgi:hypothetical protein